MVVFNYTGRELSGKIVYYGPALSGKTTNLEQIYGRTPADTRGKMVSMKTKAERTLFFDLLPVNRGTIGDFKVRFLLYTVPGQVYYNATRKLVLKGADAIVFVADSQRSQLAANIDSLRNLRTNLLEYGMCLDDLPWVITYNKRDMPDAMPIEELERELNPNGVPSFGQVSVSCQGVFEPFECVSNLLMERLEAQLRGDPAKAKRPAGPAPASVPAQVAVREMTEAIRAATPLPAALPNRQELVVQHGYDQVSAGAARPAHGPVRPAAAPAATVTATPDSPLVIQKSVVVTVPAAELQGRRKLKLVIDVTVEPK
jgi:signal recognition particle receptor subunit beta